MNLEQHECARRRPRLALSPERWNRSKGLQQAITVAFVISSLGAVGNWYNWLHGTVSFYFPLVLTVVAAAALVLTPRKWQLLVMSASGILGLAILGTALGKAPLWTGVETIVVAAAVTGVLEYVRRKVDGPWGDRDAQGATQKRD